MLQKLSIQNFILIKELGIDPDAGMNVITGETGAGKSILLGAIGLLMGQRADSKTLYSETEKCIIEGQFLLLNNQPKIGRSFKPGTPADASSSSLVKIPPITAV